MAIFLYISPATMMIAIRWLISITTAAINCFQKGPLRAGLLLGLGRIDLRGTQFDILGGDIPFSLLIPGKDIRSNSVSPLF